MSRLNTLRPSWKPKYGPSIHHSLATTAREANKIGQCIQYWEIILVRQALLLRTVPGIQPSVDLVCTTPRIGMRSAYAPLWSTWLSSRGRKTWSQRTFHWEQRHFDAFLHHGQHFMKLRPERGLIWSDSLTGPFRSAHRFLIDTSSGDCTHNRPFVTSLRRLSGLSEQPVELH